MIIIIPRKSFEKKIEKWVRPKDFLIGDATDQHDGSMNSYGNVVSCDELAGTPTIQKIALDPDSEESKIKRRNIGKYIDMWLNSEGINLKVYHLVKSILTTHSETGDDLNVFVVYRDPMFYAFGKTMVDHINDEYGVEVATLMTHKLDKKVKKEILNRQFNQDFWKALKKAHKAKKAELGIDEAKKFDVYGDAGW